MNDDEVSFEDVNGNPEDDGFTFSNQENRLINGNGTRSRGATRSLRISIDMEEEDVAAYKTRSNRRRV